METSADHDSDVPEFVSLSMQEEGDRIASLVAASRMVTFKGLKRQQFNDGNLFLSLYVRCYSNHHGEPNGYKYVDYSRRKWCYC